MPKIAFDDIFSFWNANEEDISEQRCLDIIEKSKSGFEDNIPDPIEYAVMGWCSTFYDDKFNSRGLFSKIIWNWIDCEIGNHPKY
jgi:hypothetical protein